MNMIVQIEWVVDVGIAQHRQPLDQAPAVSLGIVLPLIDHFDSVEHSCLDQFRMLRIPARNPVRLLPFPSRMIPEDKAP